MDSSITQLYILGYRRDENLFKKAYPCTLRPQGADIVRTWLYYSTLRTYQLLSDKAFRQVRISGMGLDEAGEAMHKSKGNVIWPEPILEKLGADAFRLWGASEARLGSDYRFNWSRLEGAARFITKLWNISRFISSFPVEKGPVELQPLDGMILAELNKVVEECVKGYEAMDFFIPAQAIRSFFWNIFADHYLEAVKARAYNFQNLFQDDAQRSAWKTLHLCLSTVLKLAAPICPHVTEAVWRRIYSETSIHLEEFPQPQKEWESSLGELLKPFTAFNSAVWKFKKAKNMALNSELQTVYTLQPLQPLAADLKAMHRIETLVFEQPPSGEKGLEKIEELYIRPK
jgi:valyl-tRNA synthetase